MNAVKPGWQTTEFWGKIVIQLLTLTTTFQGALDPKTGAIIIASLEAIYNVMRPYLKASATPAPADNPPSGISTTVKLLIIALLTGSMLCLQPQFARADVLDLTQLPGASQGVVWSFATNEVEYIGTWTLLSKYDFSLEGGYVQPAGACAAISYHVGSLKDLGIDTPITNIVDFNVGACGGVKQVGVANQWIGGISATLIKIKM